MIHKDFLLIHHPTPAPPLRWEGSFGTGIITPPLPLPLDGRGINSPPLQGEGCLKGGVGSGKLIGVGMALYPTPAPPLRWEGSC